MMPPQDHESHPSDGTRKPSGNIFLDFCFFLSELWFKVSHSKSLLPPEDKKEKEEKPIDAFAGIFIVWCGFLLAAVAFGDMPSAAYGVIPRDGWLTLGAIAFAYISAVVALIFIVIRLRDWRFWASLVICAIAVVTSWLRAPNRMIGP
jgi:hypothetical protein